ncbi:MAG: hypothetical protein H0W64_09370 [Gammaproteobacteria bacterium]|nr:hypothetical protein [Gammaproteobacteria bacterium]
MLTREDVSSKIAGFTDTADPFNPSPNISKLVRIQMLLKKPRNPTEYLKMATDIDAIDKGQSSVLMEVSSQLRNLYIIEKTSAFMNSPINQTRATAEFDPLLRIQSDLTSGIIDFQASAILLQSYNKNSSPDLNDAARMLYQLSGAQQIENFLAQHYYINNNAVRVLKSNKILNEFSSLLKSNILSQEILNTRVSELESVDFQSDHLTELTQALRNNLGLEQFHSLQNEKEDNLSDLPMPESTENESPRQSEIKHENDKVFESDNKEHQQQQQSQHQTGLILEAKLWAKQGRDPYLILGVKEPATRPTDILRAIRDKLKLVPEGDPRRKEFHQELHHAAEILKNPQALKAYVTEVNTLKRWNIKVQNGKVVEFNPISMATNLKNPNFLIYLQENPDLLFQLTKLDFGVATQIFTINALAKYFQPIQLAEIVLTYQGYFQVMNNNNNHVETAEEIQQRMGKNIDQFLKPFGSSLLKLSSVAEYRDMLSGSNMLKQAMLIALQPPKVVEEQVLPTTPPNEEPSKQPEGRKSPDLLHKARRAAGGLFHHNDSDTVKQAKKLAKEEDIYQVLGVLNDATLTGEKILIALHFALTFKEKKQDPHAYEKKVHAIGEVLNDPKAKKVYDKERAKYLEKSAPTSRPRKN